MRWQDRKGSDNVEDRRGQRITGRGAGVGLIGVLAVVGLSILTGKDLTPLLQLIGGGSPQAEGPVQTGAPADGLGRFASVVLADTEQTWSGLFSASGRTYEAPTLVLFAERVSSACGLASAAVGPFYCPADRKVYIDLSFFDDLAKRFGAPGDFAQAYVIAHEIGHHVQNLLGLSDRAEHGSGRAANQASVRIELQADCLAGVWAHHAHTARQLLEPGDVEEGLNAAAAIGDDRLQSLGQGSVQPESFTHGSSEQRVEWLRRGLEGGDPKVCNTM